MTDNHFQEQREHLLSSARQDFEQAYRKGFLNTILDILRRNPGGLMPFDEVRRRLPLQGQHYLGIREIAVEQIVGSVSRYNDFDRAFLPRQTHTRSRWESVDRAFLQDVILPPIEVYKLGEFYFVRDGNHRVSVARQKGQAFIDAQVIEISIPVESLPADNLETLILRLEESQFLKETGLGDSHPKSRFSLTIPAQFDKLLQHIHVHRYFMGENQAREISYPEAVEDWYQSVYRPVIKVIRRHNILKHFPGRTETDLYLWIIEHRWYLSEEWNQDISVDQAAHHFARYFSTRPWQRIKAALYTLFRKKNQIIPPDKETKKPQ